MEFNSKPLRVAGAVLLAASLWTLPASAQDRPRHHGMRGGMAGGGGTMLPLILRESDLTQDQKTQVKQIIASHREAVRDLLGQMRAAQEQVSNKLLAAGPVTEADLAPQNQQIAQLRNLLVKNI
jgi:Spy/CpxP family protein refolding chaperone